MKRLASRLFAIGAAIVLTAFPAAHAQKIKVGYWTSGVTLSSASGWSSEVPGEAGLDASS